MFPAPMWSPTRTPVYANKRPSWQGALTFKGKTVQCVKCEDAPLALPGDLELEEKFKEHLLFRPEEMRLPHFVLLPLGTGASSAHKWTEFLGYLSTNQKLAVVILEGWQLLMPPPPTIPIAGTPLRVYYRPYSVPVSRVTNLNATPSLVYTQPPQPAQPAVQARSGTHVHPSHLETLEQMHAAWAFGAVAELIDNARDAKATRLDILIEEMVSDEGALPVLQVIDNGQGMNHDEIVKMLSFGHKRPKESDTEQIGHFGVGFKTGAMRIGKDAVILTQSKNTCSMGFLSKSYNADLEILEVPIITYKRFTNGQMVLDESVCTKEDEKKVKEAVAKHSPFKNDLSIGAQFAKIEKTGTRIFVYNLEQWDGNCIFEWNPKTVVKTEASAEKKTPGDIKIRSRRVRVRAGQTSTEVPLDYSLREYAEVLFLRPCMKIYLQGTPVISRNLARTFKDVEVYHYPFIHEKDPTKNKTIPLTLGKREVEFNRANCGIFLYWHGRLIEAYRRVGAMVHSADIGRGIIGVMDVTHIMDFGDGKVGVLNNKQGFTDSDRFLKLEKWLEKTFGTYWDEKFDQYKVFSKDDVKEGETVNFEEEGHWVQCSKCDKWRELPKGQTSDQYDEITWFCYMKPFLGNCNIPEDKQEHVVTVAINRDGNKKTAQLGNGSDSSVVANTGSSSSDDAGPSRPAKKLKRLQKGTKPVKTDVKKPKS
ncbi:hypothetical protein M758_9G038700 [Ceratodon purpureus]|nr:hypothetical protein M758_9G038700 [Ceratodon purpureus]